MSADETDQTSPWPPLGLAGLALSAGLAMHSNEAPAMPPVAASGGTTGPAPSPAPALAAIPPAAAGVAIAVDAGAPDADAVLPEAVQALLANRPPGADADSAPLTAPALLHALPGAGEVRAPLLAAAVFNGEPTPTPTLNDAGFDEALGARVGWLADQKIGHAHIRLNPDDMGAIDVRLQLDGDKVQASFSSPHVDVRQALENSLPRLRDLLGEQGFQLAHADVGQHDSPGGGKPGEPRVSGLDAGDGEPAHGVMHVSSAQLARQRGLLDTYA
ncbi:flagellar hook-length control protein FliK [Stenotrophomonas sp. C3(2023)]|nr:flagellar hook-length control protein FliK [Stenotrophomonas sp. C3(2023)]